MSADDSHNPQKDLSPGAGYPAQPQSQFAQPQQSYPYPNATDYPALSDHELGLATQQFARPIDSNFTAQLAEVSQDAGTRNVDAQMRINTNGSPTQVMGLSNQQLNTQTFSPTGPRGSVDITPDSATPGDKSRIKGKASQACDACRRKKTKCITTTTEDGVPTPCNSCVKAGLDCQYSRQPLKRGPNKGYIKDLAERVNQVERIFENPGFRQSFDASGDFFMTGEEPMSARRNFSLPGGRASFSAPDFARDRFGSLNFAPLPSTTRSRDRFSIAVPPDQPIESLNFYDDIQQRPAKRVKMDSDRLAPVPSLTIEFSDLRKYYDTIHAQFSILADDSDSVLLILQAAEPELQHIFLGAVDLLPHATTNGGSAVAPKSAIKTYNEMADRLGTAFDEQLTSVANMITYVWASVLLVIHAECAIDTYNTGRLSALVIVRNYREIFKRLKSNSTGELRNQEHQDNGVRVDMIADMIGRIECMTAIQTKLVLLATASFMSTDVLDFPEPSAIDAVVGLPSTSRFLAYSSRAISFMFGSLVSDNTPLWAQNTRKVFIFMLMDEIITPRSGVDTSSVFYQQFDEFLRLLLARVSIPPTSLDCATPAAKLAELLGRNSSAYSPLEMHLYTTCVFTFLEVLALPNTPLNEFAGPVAITGLSSIRPVLQQKAADYAEKQRSQLDKTTYWGTTDGRPTIKKFWAQALLEHIDLAEAKSWVNENTLRYQHMVAAREAVPDVTGSFGQLVSQGYANVLSYYAAEHVRGEVLALGGIGGEEGAAIAGLDDGGAGADEQQEAARNAAAAASAVVEGAAQ